MGAESVLVVSNVRRILAPVVVAFFILGALFGEYFLGVPNMHSARTLTMSGELTVVVYWLLNAPAGLVWRELNAVRVLGSLWLLIGVAGIPFASYSVSASFIAESEWVCHFIFFVAMTDLVARRNVCPKDIFAGLVAAYGVTLLFLAFRWNATADPRHFDWVWGVSPFLNIRHLAFLGMPAFIAVLAFVFSRSRIEAYAGTLLASLFLGSLFWAGGRASIGAALLALFLAAAYGQLNSQLSITRALVSIILIVLLAFGLAELFYVDNASMGLSLVHGRDGVGTMNELSSGRWDIWKSVWTDMSFSERLIGIGVDNYRYLPGRADSTVQPHSIVVQAFASWGFLGAGIFLVGLVCLAVRVWVWTWKFNRDPSQFSWDSTVLALMLLGSALLSLVDGNLYHSWSTMIVVSVLAAGFGLHLSKTALYTGKDVSLQRPLGASWLYASGILIVLTALQFANNAIVFGNKIPDPASGKANLVMMLPYNTLTVEQWLPVWQRESQEDMVRLLSWLERNASDRYRFMLLESQMLRDRGYQQKAVEKYQQALSWAPKKERVRLEDLGPPEALSAQ